MIKVKVQKVEGYYKSISILGHAMYDDYGKDIVCSAVSSITTTTINGILTIKQNAITYLVSSKGLTIKVLSTDRVTQLLLKNMVKLFKELELKYKENIEVK
ncbi:MAG TPA: ribosomal-processing cysteine protease Prp [Candidatus Onthousia faecavium]|nr:ribosomal-processing cysteine protease Prp [Candidatus Onthousia faecavium]